MTRDSKQRINETSSGPRDVARHEHSSRKCLPGSIHFTGVAAVETMNAMHAQTLVCRNRCVCMHFVDTIA